MTPPEPVMADIYDLFGDDLKRDFDLGPDVRLLAGFAHARAGALLAAVSQITQQAPFRRMSTPGGRPMSVAMTNCGTVGWITDHAGYRYARKDPVTELFWPEMPSVIYELATSAAREAGFTEFDPDACLINRYEPGTKLSLHQDKNEQDFDHPIVSVSLGLPATFLWRRERTTARVPLSHGDVLVWSGTARLTYHGVDILRNGDHPATGPVRYNLTFRRAR